MDVNKKPSDFQIYFWFRIASMMKRDSGLSTAGLSRGRSSRCYNCQDIDCSRGMNTNIDWKLGKMIKIVKKISLAHQSSGPSSGLTHLLLTWSKTRPSVHPSSLGVVENSQTMYFLHEVGWGNEGWARGMPLGPMVSPSGHSKPSMLALTAATSHFLAKEEACSSLTQVPWASSKMSGGGQS